MDDATTTGDAPAARELPLEFRAQGGEYFRIWIVNLLLTVVTLGIYSAWAKVRRLRYFYGSTSLAGSSFEYHGQPIAILKGRLIVAGFYLLFIGATYFFPLANVAILPLIFFGVPWIMIRSRLFQMRMTSWRGLRFNFHGRYGGAMAVFIGWPILAVLTLTILWPMALWKQVRFLVTHTAFGSQRFSFGTRVGRFYRLCLISIAIAAGLGVGGVLLFTVLGGGLIAAMGSEQEAPQAVGVAMAIVLTGVMMLVGLVVGAYFRSQFLNASIGGVEVGPHRVQSRLETAPLLGILVTNLLGMVVTLGLFYPWAHVRLLRYQISRTSVLTSGDIDQFVASAVSGPSALGEEAGDFFDVDFGI